MGYYIDLSEITIDEYAIKLKNGYLPPSRKLLLDNIDEKFQLIQEQGIKSVAELQDALKTKKKLAEFSDHSNLPVDYLTILIREINSSLPKPNRIKDFPEIENVIVEKLEKIGIKNTVHLYQKIRSESDRKKLAIDSGIEEEWILKLAKYADLSRVKWVNHTFAFMLYETGYKTVKKLSSANAEELHKAIAEINRERNFYKGSIGLNDIRICINAANEVTQDIEF